MATGKALYAFIALAVEDGKLRLANPSAVRTLIIFR